MVVPRSTMSHRRAGSNFGLWISECGTLNAEPCNLSFINIINQKEDKMKKLITTAIYITMIFSTGVAYGNNFDGKKVLFID